jgi:hypothetical protein
MTNNPWAVLEVFTFIVGLTIILRVTLQLIMFFNQKSFDWEHFRKQSFLKKIKIIFAEPIY